MNTPKPPPLPEIDYEALIAAAYKRDRKWAQGTNGCVAFKCGAEWFREQAIASIQAQGVPDGWRLVPDELTREMWEAVNKVDDSASAGGSTHGADFESLWYAALASAPPAPQAERCKVCNYQHGHQIGCENNPVDIALKAQASVVQQPKFWYDEEEGLLYAPNEERPEGCIPFYTHPAQQANPQSLSDEQQIAAALRKHGLMLVKTTAGYDVMKLGECTAHGIVKE